MSKKYPNEKSDQRTNERLKSYISHIRKGLVYLLSSFLLFCSGSDCNGNSSRDTNNDTAGVTIIQTGGNTVVSEDGTTDTYTVRLNTQPTDNVVIAATSSDVSVATVSTNTLTFTPDNWDDEQTVTVIAVDDNIDERMLGTVMIALMHVIDTEATIDEAYDALTGLTSVTVTVIDDDTAGVTIMQTEGNTVVSEDGTKTDTYTVRLNTQPAGNVVIAATSSDVSVATVSTNTLTFTPDNWDDEQTVTITARNNIMAGANPDVTIMHAIDGDATMDPAYDALTGLASITVTVIDDDTAGVTIIQTDGNTVVSEDGTKTDTYTVRLNTQPAGNVVIAATSSDVSVATVSTNTLTFTPDNWDDEQTVTVIAVDDDIDERMLGDVMITITHAIDGDATMDVDYDALTGLTSVTVTVIDDDMAGVKITDEGRTPIRILTLNENGGTAVYIVRLNSQPMASVTVNPVSSDVSVATVSTNTLTFTPDNWDDEQTVTVIAVDDDIDERMLGDVMITITHAIDKDATMDPAYAALTGLTSVTVKVIDNDMAGVRITDEGGTSIRILTLNENGGTAVYIVRLNSQPMASVTVNPVSSDVSVATVSTNTLTFTPTNWNNGQRVTVTGIDNIIDDGILGWEITITHGVSSGDAAYNVLGSGPDVTVKINDDGGDGSGDKDSDGTLDSVDVDDDNDGLIEIHNLSMLNNVRYNLAGTSYKTSASDSGSAAGAPTTNCSGRATRLCGYELTRNQNFKISAHYASEATKMSTWTPDNIDADLATNAGFPGFGGSTSSEGGISFTGVFEGNNHIIDNFYRRNTTTTGNFIGLFNLVGSGAIVRNVGVVNAQIYGGGGFFGDMLGVLVGSNQGTITAGYTSGNLHGSNGNRSRDIAGGLVGGNSGTITASHATGDLSVGTGSGQDTIGGLVGENTRSGIIAASYAMGDPIGGNGVKDKVGGLVGENAGTIIASYATGNPDGGAGNDDRVGGLVGINFAAAVLASYAIGNPNGGAGDNDFVGGLIGESLRAGSVAASYATGNPDGGSGSNDLVGGLVGRIERSIMVSYAYAFGMATGEVAGHGGSIKPSGVTRASQLMGNSGDATTYAGDGWNSLAFRSLGAWNFGTSNQNPALVYNDYDGLEVVYACSKYPATIPGTTMALTCRTTFVGGAANQGR